MKKLTSTLVALATLATAVAADSAINALKVKDSLDKVNTTSSVWKGAKFSDITLYPQTTIEFNDKKANELNTANKAVKAKVAAVYNDKKIAFLIQWADGTKNIQQSDKTDSYADGFAVQFASNYANPAELPYIGMGSEGRPAVIHLQKESTKFFEPNGKGDVALQVNPEQTNYFEKELKTFKTNVDKVSSTDYEKSYVGEGFRSMTEIKDGTNKSQSTMTYTKSGWAGTLSRPLKDEYVNLNAAAIPVAFAVWDGEKMGRNGLKYLTGWNAVVLKKGDNALVNALHGKIAGDAVKGKDTAMANGCTGCHQMEVTDAPNLMGPSLTNIGGYSSADYLRESLVNPSAVVVPGYNRNAHSNYAWYNIEDGKRVSTMPDHSWMEKADIDDIVAYLTTLKSEVK